MSKPTSTKRTSETEAQRAISAQPASDIEAETVNAFAAPVGPAAIVIFGASGDLTKRKLLPAIYNLASDKLVNEQVSIIGVARTEMDTEAFRLKIAEEIGKYATRELDPRVKDRLLHRIHYLAGDFAARETHQRLKKLLLEVDQKHKTGGNYLFYLATAPEMFGPVVRELGAAGLTVEEAGGWRRVIIEKPFGRDLASAKALNAEISTVLREEQIYRIDHYLGKETVQNILVFRFGNGMFEPIWNRRYIDNVQITVAEALGVEGRGGYYDTAGALRDMVPNHLLQLLALTAMEPPTSFAAETVREEKTKVLRAISPMTREGVRTHAVRGQYGAGTIAGERVPAYRAESRVDPRSQTETFAAMKLSVDNWRWADVPFYLRTGKRMASRVSEIAIQFRRPPLLLFRNTPVEHLTRNVLVIRVQPEDGITLRFGAKVPGPTLRVGNVAMDFCYRDYFGANPSTGYETLLYDCMKGDPTLFQRADMVEVGWSIVDPILQAWSESDEQFRSESDERTRSGSDDRNRSASDDRNRSDSDDSNTGELPSYAAGTWGPKAADELLERDGKKWRKIES